MRCTYGDRSSARASCSTARTEGADESKERDHHWRRRYHRCRVRLSIVWRIGQERRVLPYAEGAAGQGHEGGGRTGATRRTGKAWVGEVERHDARSAFHDY